jgi:hypothetical protein
MRTRSSSILAAGSFCWAWPAAVLYSELYLGQIFA